MFDDPLEFYEAIARELAKVAPKGWRSVEVEASSVGEASIEIKVVYEKSFGKRGAARAGAEMCPLTIEYTGPGSLGLILNLILVSGIKK